MSADSDSGCANCGSPTAGAVICRDGIALGPLVSLCDACASPAGPSAEQIWYRIAKEGQFAEARDAGVPLEQLLRDVSRAELHDAG